MNNVDTVIVGKDSAKERGIKEHQEIFPRETILENPIFLCAYTSKMLYRLHVSP